MKVTTFETTTESGFKVTVAEDDYDYAKRDAQQFKNLYKGSEGKEECIICGKYTEQDLYIQMSINGYWLPADCNEAAEGEGGESQGWFVIGSGCASAFPNGFVKKW